MHCQQWLVKSGWLAKILIFHVPNERRGGKGAGMHFKRLGVMAGVADYLAFAGQRRIAIELKDEDGKQHATQDTFQKRWELAGGEYYLVRTLEDFQHVIGGTALWSS